MLQADRLRSLRLKNNHTYASLAKAISLTMRQIVRYEAGEADPSSDVVTRMANVFNVSADYLLGRTDDPTPPAHQSDLTPDERDILAALRRDDPLTAIKLIVQTLDKPDSNLPN
ncbi:MAG: helix-turn-helix domain-containing protein [Anaerolineaceae bacterium]|nr:helix-turn-helix domain-containing protein [Anaerolineaceae bacterium]